MSKALLLFGGGVDSAALGMWMFKQGIPFDCILFDYQQKAFEGEYHAAMHFMDVWGSHLHIDAIRMWNKIQHPMLLNGVMAQEHSKNVLALRNQAFLTAASIRAIDLGYDSLYIGFHQEPADSQFHDARIEFGLGFQALLHMQGIELKIEMPFANLTKAEYIHHLNPFHLSKTFSCYESQTRKECGICTHCQQKKEYILQSGNVD